MKNILTVTQVEAEKKALQEIIGTRKEEIKVLSVESEGEAIRICSDVNIDLLIVDLTSRQNEDSGNVARLTYAFPYIPCIAVIDDSKHRVEDFLKVGVSCCLKAPLKAHELNRWMAELIDVSRSGILKGIPVHSLLQMVESEGKTCTLKISSRKKSGLIFIEKGEVIAAETGDQENESALYAIIGWDDVTIEIRHYNCLKKRGVKESLISIIMEAIRLKDEKESLVLKQAQKNMPSLNLQQFSTADQQLTFEPGLRLKIEMEGKSDPLSTVLIGVDSDKYLLLSTPEKFGSIREQLIDGEQIVIKYLHMGRLCIFRSSLVTEIDEPSNILFFTFPKVIYYHELRKAKRTSLIVPCTVSLREGPDYFAIITDLNSTGCHIRMKAKKNAPLPNIDIGTKITLSCLLPGLHEKEKLKGVVRNLKKRNSKLAFGIQFADLPGGIRRTIDNYLGFLSSITKQ